MIIIIIISIADGSRIVILQAILMLILLLILLLMAGFALTVAAQLVLLLLIHIGAVFLTRVSKCDLEVIAFLRFATIEVSPFIMVNAAAVLVSYLVHEPVSIQIAVIFVVMIFTIDN